MGQETLCRQITNLIDDNNKLQAEVARLRELLSLWYVRTSGRPQQLLDDTAKALEGE